MPRKRKEEVTIEPGKGLNLDPELIKQLVPGRQRLTIWTTRSAAISIADREDRPPVDRHVVVCYADRVTNQMPTRMTSAPTT